MSIFKRKNTAPVFKALAGDGLLCLDIYDTIGSDFFGDGITAGMVSEAIKSNPGMDITLNINSPGGDLFEGVAIYNVLKASGKTVTVNVVGLAASAASLIAMAGDTVTMQLGTQMMIHEALSMTAGFASDMRKMADTLDSVTTSAADIYVAKTGMSKDKVLEMMASETWLNPEDAVKNKFATSTGKAKGVKNSFDLSMYKHAPIDLLEKTKEVELAVTTGTSCTCECEPCVAGQCLDCSNVECVEPECMDCQMKAKSVTNHISLFRKQLELNKRK